MKRFSAREALLLCLPALALLAVPLALSWVQPQPNAIRVVTARPTLPLPAHVARSADVAALLKMDGLPDAQFPTQWKVAVRLVAGNHLLWNDKQSNIEREVGVGWRSLSGASYVWSGAFDLDQVPPSWGEVAVKWDAKLVQERRFWLRAYSQTSRKNGHIVLRRKGENIVAPKVSRDSHLKLLRVEIGTAKTIDNGTTLSYPIRFYFERDSISRKTAPRINCDYKVRPHDGFMTLSSQNGSDEITRWYTDIKNDKAASARRFPIVTHRVDVDKKWELQGKSWVDCTISHGDFWPLRVSVPFSDAHGRVLIGTSHPKPT